MAAKVGKSRNSRQFAFRGSKCGSSVVSRES